MSNESFRPVGNSVLAAASSSTAGTPTALTPGGMPSCYVANPSTSSLYIAFGSSTIQAAVPTTAIPTVGLCLLSAQARVFNAGPDSFYISAVTSAGSASAFATPGVGQ